MIGVELVATTVAVCLAIAVVALMYGSLASSRPIGQLLGRLYVALFAVVTPYWPLQPTLNVFVAILLWILQWILISAWVGRRVKGLPRPKAFLWTVVSVLVVAVVVDAVLRLLGYRRIYM